MVNASPFFHAAGAGFLFLFGLFVLLDKQQM
jgi:hypothetical protein